MSLRAYPAALVLVAASVVPSTAQTRLALADAVQAALSKNPMLRAADASVEEARLHASEARASFLPRVVFTESWQRSDAPVFAFSSLLSARRFSAEDFGLPALNHPRPSGWFRASLGIEQQWFDGGRRRAALRESTLGATAAQARRDEAAAGLMLATTRVYGRLIEAESRERAARAASLAADEDLARAMRRRDLGLVTDADVLAVSVHRADLEQRAIQAAGDAAVARAELNRLMGAPIGDVFTVVEPIYEVVAAEPSLEALLADADTQRPELRRARLQEEIASAGRSRARSAYLPSLATQALVDMNGTAFLDRASSWMAGGELRWSFSLGGAENASLKASAERVVRARAEAEDARAEVHVEVVTAFRRLESARARLLAGQSAVDQAREQHRIIRDRFDAGLATANDVLQGSASMLAAEANRTAAMVDAIVSRAELARAAGRVSQRGTQ